MWAAAAVPAEGGELIGAIIANAGLAAMDIADGGAAPSVAPLLHEVEASTARATMLYTHIRSLRCDAALRRRTRSAWIKRDRRVVRTSPRAARTR